MYLSVYLCYDKRQVDGKRRKTGSTSNKSRNIEITASKQATTVGHTLYYKTREGALQTMPWPTTLQYATHGTICQKGKGGGGGGDIILWSQHFSLRLTDSFLLFGCECCCLLLVRWRYYYSIIRNLYRTRGWTYCSTFIRMLSIVKGTSFVLVLRPPPFYTCSVVHVY